MKISELKNPRVVFDPSKNQAEQLPELASTASQIFPENGFMSKIGEAGLDFVKGIGKGFGSTIFGIGKLGERLVNPIERTLGIKETKTEKPELLVPQGLAQKIGFGTEQIAEFLLPGGAVLKGAKGIEAAGQVAKLSPLAQGALKVGGRAILEGATSGGIRAAQTGSFKEGAKFGAVTGGISGVFGTTGEILRKTGISEKLYSQVFKNTADDMFQELKTGALQNLQNAKPEEFAQLVEAGIIRAGKDGKGVCKPTLAREALDRGLKGSLKNMTNEVVRQNLNYELQAQNLVRGFGQKIKITEPKKYANLLKQVEAQYKGTFLQSRADLAKNFRTIIEKSKGTISAENTLKLRRFLDSMRRASSYRPNPALSIAQEDFKKATDLLRGNLSDKIPGMGKLMNEYRFTFDALESLGKEAAKRGNSALVNLIDTALFGFGGVLTQGVAGAAAFPLTRRALTLPSVTTRLGSMLEKGIKGTFGRLIKGGAAQIIPP